MKILAAIVAVLGLAAFAALGAGALGLRLVFGVIVPAIAIAVFCVGFTVKVIGWSRVPVPFRIPTTCGQQRSLAGIRRDRLGNPATPFEAAARVLREALCFTALFGNTRSELREGPALSQVKDRALFCLALAFHAALFIVWLRHLRLFLEPIPAWVQALCRLDGFFEIGTPVVFITTAVLLGALACLALRRLGSARLRYLAQVNDYVPLFLLLGIGATGVWMRHFGGGDVEEVKAFALGVLSFSLPPLPAGSLFYVHLTLVSALVAGFPFGKLMHAAGLFLSPTLNLANTSRAKRHINPWNPAVELHGYAAYEDEFRDKMRGAGLPLEREP